MASPEDTVDRLNTALADRYAIEREIGSGGMATVYLAQDLKHNRKVAVKVLMPELAAILGTERFLKEIEVTANLQHPHILPLHDSGEVDNLLFYVMPHVDGESLREKLDREKQLGVEDTVEIAKSVAAALDYAHAQGVVHRDIKPENILLQTGQALVADFGIAVAISQAGGARLTETGLSLGTPHYMSPEQAAADRELDARSDVYSLGAVVYEMLVGEPPHVGNSAQAIVAKILTDTPAPIARTRELVPANVEAAVCSALAKTPADRFSSAADFSAALLNSAFTLPTQTGGGESGTSAGTRMWRGATFGMTAVALLLTILVLWPDPPAPPRPVTRRLMAFLPGQEPQGGVHLAPDGSWHVYVGPGESGSQLWIKRNDELEATPLAGTDGADSPSVSPDGRSIAFVVGSELRRIPATGGTSVTLSDSASVLSSSIAWLDDGTLVFNDLDLRLRHMSDTGGPAEVVWPRLADPNVDPAFSRGSVSVTPLPDARGVLFGVCTGFRCEAQEVWALDLRTGDSHRVLSDAFAAGYTKSGHLVAQSIRMTDMSGNLFAVPFDLETLRTSGEPVGLWNDAILNSVSDEGTLLVGFGNQSPLLSEVVWVDRDGDVTQIDESWRFEIDPESSAWALSPDGSRLVIGLGQMGNAQLWIKQLEGGAPSQLTFDGYNSSPRWTPDGRFVMFVRSSENHGIYTKRADGMGLAELVYSPPSPTLVFEVATSGNTDWIVARTGGNIGLDIVGFPPGIDSSAVPLLVEEYDEMTPELSPDGRWLAYTSNESGESQVFVTPFPNVGDGKWTASLGGGHSPLWAHNERELFYVSAANEMVAASVVTDSVFEVTGHNVLFQISSDFFIDPLHTAHDISSDDQRFIMVREMGQQDSQSQLFEIGNFFELLRERMGG